AASTSSPTCPSRSTTRPERSTDSAGDANHRGAVPVAGARAAGPELAGEAILLGARRLVGVRRAATHRPPGLRDELVVAGRARRVGTVVDAPGLALHDRPRDRPAAGALLAAP